MREQIVGSQAPSHWRRVWNEETMTFSRRACRVWRSRSAAVRSKERRDECRFEMKKVGCEKDVSVVDEGLVGRSDELVTVVSRKPSRA